ncbi:MAG TPA: hypothetical protein ENF17_02230 [Candidatus Aminicenantes bacterium]|nr:hypothetical protein [Candidatus Aminicenantes bacterium]
MNKQKIRNAGQSFGEIKQTDQLKAKGRIWILFCLLIWLSASSGQSMLQPQAKVKKTTSTFSPKKAVEEQIVHVELLPAKKNFEAPVRNIFLPSWRGASSQNVPEGVSLTSEQGVYPQNKMTLDTPQGESTSSWNITLEYVGYIKSADGVVALLIYQSQPWVVRSGDILDDGSVISAISEEEIEILGPNKEKKIFRFIEEKP